MSLTVRKDLLTTREAAAVLGVGTTSIKRWADDGLLDCVRTPGGHRRFTRAAVYRIRGVVSYEDSTAPISEWVKLLTRGDDLNALISRIHQLAHQRGDYWEAAAFLGEVLEEVGRLWNLGEISVIEEHLASERMLRAVAAAAASIRVPDKPRTALLLVAEGEIHTLGLCLVELCMRDAGWISRMPGARTPFAPVRDYIARHDISCVMLGASMNAANAGHLAEQAERYAELCRAENIPLVLGGRGAWPNEPDYGFRARTFEDLRALVEDQLG